MYPFTTHTDGNKSAGDIFKALNHVTILEFYRGKVFVQKQCVQVLRILVVKTLAGHLYHF